MAYSARILALIQKIDAADAEHFARLREQAKKAAAARVEASKKKQASPPRVVKPLLAQKRSRRASARAG